jgi:hypothetical protein
MGIRIAPTAGAPMEAVQSVRATYGTGLEGDRYWSGSGSYNKDLIGKRQVTLMNALFFSPSWDFGDTRRNLFTLDVELMDLIGKEFQIGDARLLGLEYCDPCKRVDKLSGKEGFRERFFDRGGLLASVTRSGLIRVGDSVIPPKKKYSND